MASVGKALVTKRCEFQLRDGQLLLSIKYTNQDTKENRGMSDHLVWDTLKLQVVAIHCMDGSETYPIGLSDPSSISWDSTAPIP